ncbi:Defective in cullin neddylation protein [Aphelenchoides besseyi]|nr:Defective in cullin neddylation protein [Aphelenchoides besseyi]
MSSKLKTQQKEKLRNFIMVTNSNETIGLQCLQHVDWNLEMAFDVYYNNPTFHEASKSVDNDKIDSTFRKYANLKEDRSLCEDPDRIGPNGVLKLLQDLSIDPTDLAVLILAWKMEAETQCEFSLAEFRKGFRKMNVSSVSQLKQKLRQIVDETVNSKPDFEAMYRFTFDYARSTASKALDIETALNYWTLVLSRINDKRINHWMEFLREKQIKGISRDLWNMFLRFLWDNDPAFSNHDAEQGCWPVMMDQFVDHVRLVHPDLYPTLDPKTTS